MHTSEPLLLPAREIVRALFQTQTLLYLLFFILYIVRLSRTMRLRILSVILIVFNAPLFIYIHLTPRIQEFLARFISPCGVENRTEFDFIVVGAGSAGSVVAGRLAEHGHQVLLLEAGGPANWFMTIPYLSPLFQKTPYDWQYSTVPQKYGELGYLQGKF